MNGHQILAIVELVIYATLLAPVTFCTFYYLFKKQVAWLYLHAFVIAKIAGPAIYLAIAKKSNPSRDLQMASQILYSIALGPLLSATLSFVNTSPTIPPKHPDQNNVNDHTAPTAYLGGGHRNSVYTPLTLVTPHKHQGANKINTVLRLIHLVIIVALVLGIISGTGRAPSSDGTINEDKYDSGAKFAKVSSALFLIALFGIVLGAGFLFMRRKRLPILAAYIIRCMPIILPLLFIRVLYSVLGAANLDTTDHRGHTGKYNVLTGSWAVYLVLGLIPQGAVLMMYAGCGIGGWWSERRLGRH
ncbi:hypothetical protein BJX63DRAFT_440367 [Aspergillus granulosus]|uniref:DUF7702 domain-containing protein n=1 Tax=Aspergillus granulosus TaxID=176169 RepID=A0ABR4GVL9_9EURO